MTPEIVPKPGVRGYRAFGELLGQAGLYRHRFESEYPGSTAHANHAEQNAAIVASIRWHDRRAEAGGDVVISSTISQLDHMTSVDRRGWITKLFDASGC
ncbi:hypothetical protein [Carbonactinospora thermoautotrophica]|uniref:hypothetical protein n=1 Tax=Carbonactinospora thermoautotrophica TaxID=1469144 RepID=UPI00226E03FC|nr:hypothetical protein [Carbonactinospora thermoautotrophica]